jgi:hypothetical protein
MDDEIKLQFKKEHEDRVEKLRVYNQSDSSEYPGWTFLLPSVIKTYGICPMLQLKNKDKRESWLETTSDGGIFYRNAVGTVGTTGANTRDPVVFEIEMKRDQMIDLVSEKVDKDVTDGIIESVRLKKEAKSQNKKIKDAWNQAITQMNCVFLNTGIDFGKFISVTRGWTVRYKPPSSRNEDLEFSGLCDDLVRLQTRSTLSIQSRRVSISEAEKQLVYLIEHDFNIDQDGRYFKKWSSLSPEKKENRIRSYCEWFIRHKNLAMETVDTMFDWIVTKLSSKELQVKDIVWNGKIGIISDIKIQFDPTASDFNLTPKDGTSSKKNTKKKSQEICDSLLVQRINRLLLFEIVNTTTPDQNTIVSTVLKNLRLRKIDESSLLDHIVPKCIDMIETVKIFSHHC